MRPWTWPWLIATASARALLTVVVGLALWASVPAIIGWQPTTVSSGSMLPRLQVGDVAVSRPLRGQPPTIGSVLLFDDPDHPDRLRLHRFVAVSDDGLLITRGDANPADDSSPVNPSAVHGVGTLRVPWVGLPVIWVREQAWLPLGLTLLVLVGLGVVAAQARRFTFDPPDDPPSAAAEPEPNAPTTSATAGTLARVASGPLAVATSVIMIAVPSVAAFSATTTSAASLGANLYFTCTKAISSITPYLWYRMDETSTLSTSATDSSGSSRTGTYSPSSIISPGRTPVADRSCAASTDTARAMTFNGSTGYLSSPATSGAAPNTFTIMIRFKTAANYAKGGKLIGYGSSRTGASSSYDRHLYMTNSGQIVFGVYPNAVKVVESSKSYNDGKWHLALASLSSAGMRLYVDGDLVDSDTSVVSGQALTAGFWRIAYDSLDSWPDRPDSLFFAGTLDDAVVWNTTALSDDQAKAQWYASTCATTSVTADPAPPPC